MYSQILLLEPCWPVVLFQVYVNSFLALLNARYYGQVNTDSDNSYAFHHRHEVYRPELHAGTSQEEELQASRNDMFQHPDDELVPSRSVKVSASSCIIWRLDDTL
jgi:hypothetical protein